jgi:desulfoferrodoxin (superoxide reductase-like protein)
MTLLPRCGPDPSTVKADGSYEAPYTAEDPGAFAAEVPTSVPVLYGALLDATRVRLWLEVLNNGVQPAASHPMLADHYIQELRLLDGDNNELAYVSYPAEAQARLIRDVELPAEVETIHAFAKCSKHGVWRSTWSVADLKKAPVGDLRRAYTADQPGPYADKILAHVPILGKRPDGSFAVEVGDRAAGKLHEMSENHHIQHVVVLDQGNQTRVDQPLGPTVAEPVVEGVNVNGTQRVRVVALCNLHFYWQADYGVT